MPSRAWVDWPGHIWAQSWNEGAIFSPDGMTIQFDRGTVAPNSATAHPRQRRLTGAISFPDGSVTPFKGAERRGLGRWFPPDPLPAHVKPSTGKKRARRRPLGLLISPVVPGAQFEPDSMPAHSMASNRATNWKAIRTSQGALLLLLLGSDAVAVCYIPCRSTDRPAGSCR